MILQNCRRVYQAHLWQKIIIMLAFFLVCAGVNMKRLIFIATFLCGLTVLGQEALLESLSLGQIQAKTSEEKKESEPEQNVGFSCRNPRATLRSFLFGESSDLVKCFEPSPLIEDLHEKNDRLALVFRAHGISINLDNISNDADYKDNNKRARYAISHLLPKIYLEKINNQWLFPVEVINSIDELYAQATRINLGPLYRFAPEWSLEDLFGISGFSSFQIFLICLLIFAGMVARQIAAFLVARQVSRALVKLGFSSFEKSLKKASMPIGNLVMAALVAVVLPSLALNVHLVHYLFLCVRIGAALSAVMLAYRSVDVLSHFLMQRALKTESKLDDHLVPLFRRGLKITVTIVGTIFILQNLNVDVTSLLAGVTIGGLAFSFAAKDTVANLFGSITIFADKPFLVGDWVKAAGVEGIVEGVGFRSTRIRTFYNSLVSVPNSKFTDSVVDNMGARQYRRNLSELGIAYDTSPEQIEAFCNGIRAILKAHAKIRKDYYEIHFSGYGDYALKIMLYFFMKVSGYSEEMRVRHEIYLDILRLARKLDISFAFPTQTLHVETMAKAREITRKEKPSLEEMKVALNSFAPGGNEVIDYGPRLGEGYFPQK